MKNISECFNVMTAQLLMLKKYFMSLKQKISIDAARAFLVKVVINKLFPGCVTINLKESTRNYNVSVKEVITTDPLPRASALSKFCSSIVNQVNMSDNIRKKTLPGKIAIIAACGLIVYCIKFIFTRKYNQSGFWLH